ncbi:arylsulfatase [Haloactinopolyspora alba]|uniref:Arylsulfatase n=1 Tax=Haloactinopolyspora alba TaxID=648780 RepID=A0A2P8E7L4_9ACTN|nr:arylsulfatase [Haloactinopolyspora alba]PSL05473.1 arylsulfatase [Haloactinopolyspora alba]
MSSVRVSETWANDDFAGEIGRTYRDSRPSWPAPPPTGSLPNVMFVVLDDTGFGSLGCYGSEISTPAIDRLAREGTRFSNFHATALCSPTRASLLTGRNHHNVGLGYLSHVDDGYPGYRGQVTHRAATLAEILVDHGYNTMAVGKWHLAPMDQTTAAGPYHQWPLGRGFERYYGFLEGLTDHYYPELFSDNHAVEPAASPEDGYHLNSDLVDTAIGFVRDQTSVAPEKPFFMYLAFGATHTPFQPPAEYVDRYSGVYDAGWDEIRRRRFERQVELGVVPPGTELPPHNEGVEAWDALSPEARRLYPKFQEVFAGFLEHTDRELGRLLDYLESIGRLDDTMVVLVSDNGASQEGGPHGVLNTTMYENGHLPGLDENLARITEIDGFTTHVNYPLGWAEAANTPLKRYKQNTHAGGIRTPMIMRFPGSVPEGEIRDQFHHVTDIVPTVLDVAGLDAPTTYRGVDQLALDGVSIRATLESPDDAPRRPAQYFETLGHRAIWKDGWKAVAYHAMGTDFDDDVWELYHLDTDFSECHDLAGAHPDLLAELVAAWWAEAGRNGVLPLDDRRFAERSALNVRPDSPRNRSVFTYHRGMHHLGSAAAPMVAGRSFEIRAAVGRDAPSDNGVLIAHGSVNSGYCLMIDDGLLVYDFNYYGSHTVVRSDIPVPIGEAAVAMRFDKNKDDTSGRVRLFVDGDEVGSGSLSATFEHLVAFQGLDVGADGLSPAREGGNGRYPFAGRMDRIVVEVFDDTEPASSDVGSTSGGTR